MTYPKLQSFNFMTAEDMITQKEELLERLIHQYFEWQKWDEDHLAEYASFEVSSDGYETFMIADTKLIRFHPIQSNYTVEGHRVYIKLDQPYEILIGE